MAPITLPIDASKIKSGTWEEYWLSEGNTGDGDFYYDSPSLNINNKKTIYNDNHGAWEDSNSGYSGWWWSSHDDINYQGISYDGSAVCVIDADNNGIYNSKIDYIVGYAYGGGDGWSGSWERDEDYSGTFEGGSFGDFYITVALDFKGKNTNDTALGSTKKDKFRGKGGNDTFYGYESSDRFWGDNGNDKLYGGSGKDKLNGGKGKDKLYGGSGKDKLNGGNGNDKLIGGNGNDKLYGGSGKDNLIGGKGKDIFKLSSGKGYDLIQDFKNKQDKIYIGSSKNLKLKNKGKDVFIYSGKDLLAKVKGAKGDLSKQGKYLV